MALIKRPVFQNKKVKPKVGFIGVGWIGINRLMAIQKENIVEIDAIADTDDDALIRAQEHAPEARLYENLEELIKGQPEGVVIATPSALHAHQCIYAIERGASVFCQKPLGRTANETKSVVEAAHKHNKLLGVDFSYRFTEGMQKIYHLAQSGLLGNIYAVNLVFLNAYGPDKSWFYNSKLSGGGCVIDLGIHLIDLALWVLDFPPVLTVSSSLFAKGKAIYNPETETEDYAVATLETENGVAIQLTCSWNLHAGLDALIEATFYGTEGGASFKNVKGSFYDFEAHRFFSKTQKEILCSPPDKWGGKAASDWARRLAKGETFNKDAFEFIKIAEIIDKIYKK